MTLVKWHYLSVNIWSLAFTEFIEFEITEFLCSSLKLLNLYSVVLLCSSPYNVLMLKNNINLLLNFYGIIEMTQDY